MFQIQSLLKNLSLTKQSIRTIFVSGPPLHVQATLPLFGEPLKKKRRLDPVILKARDERRKKKLAREIRKLQKQALTLKPVDELEIPVALKNPEEAVKRVRTDVAKLSDDEIERRILLEKSWTRYKKIQFDRDLEMMERMVRSQEYALDQLFKVSPELYKAAIQPDMTIVKFNSQPATQTPPIKNYDSPDGDYVDISKKW